MLGIIKKIDVYILRKYLLLFVGAFCICLFVLMMQFMWRYIDELIGKGLEMEVMARFFWHMALTLVPMALPLSILLTSLISFGNMGENLELTAMKSAGIPLIRIMRPLIILAVVLMGVSFYFQNYIAPNAQKQLTRMLVTMKETSPAIEIPEGVFYNGIPNVNIYVKTKNAKTGMLYDVIIYKMDQGFENAQIVMADSARLATTADKHFLQLTIFSGEQFENLQSQGQMARRINVPYDRETFKEKTLLIDFDSGFELMSEGMFNNMARVKNLRELEDGADSITRACDSIGLSYFDTFKSKYMARAAIGKDDSARAPQVARAQREYIVRKSMDLSPEKRLHVLKQSQDEVRRIKSELEWERPMTANGYLNAKKHLIKWHEIFSLSLACLIFFFIGAPLGAIIRKGGLGLPTVVSVVIFIFYYIVNTSGMKLSKEGELTVWFGMWVSTLILAPVGFFLTYKSNRDSVVFNVDNYLAAVKRFFGVRRSRLYMLKSVVISEPDYARDGQVLREISRRCDQYIKDAHLPLLPNYVKVFFGKPVPDAAQGIVQDLENVLEDLSNSRDARLLTAMNAYPEVSGRAHLSPFGQRGTNIAIGILFPLGLIVGWRMWRYRIRLFRDFKAIIKTNNAVVDRIDTLQNN
ncbi:MAG: LptF/LptG family permease [Bacteroidaceae bacterium]|nr:LptF/LptG family permease [Bacteroidaceae bacterium]